MLLTRLLRNISIEFGLNWSMILFVNDIVDRIAMDEEVFLKVEIKVFFY